MDIREFLKKNQSHMNRKVDLQGLAVTTGAASWLAPPAVFNFGWLVTLGCCLMSMASCTLGLTSPTWLWLGTAAWSTTTGRVSGEDPRLPEALPDQVWLGVKDVLGRLLHQEYLLRVPPMLNRCQSSCPLLKPAFSLYTIHYTSYTLNITLYTIHYTLYTIHYTLYTLHCTICTIHYTLYILHYTLYTIKYPL